MTNATSATRQSIGRLLWSWGDKALMLGLIGALAIGSNWLNVCAGQPNRSGDVAVDDTPGAGIIVDTEVVRLWLPESVIDLAAQKSEFTRARVHQELCTGLECQEENHLWYALTIRCYQTDGRAVEITSIRRPCVMDAPSFTEFLDVLATADGNPPAKYSAADVRIVAGNPPVRLAREIVEKLVSGL
jgi:hypothetical protein